MVIALVHVNFRAKSPLLITEVAKFTINSAVIGSASVCSFAISSFVATTITYKSPQCALPPTRLFRYFVLTVSRPDVCFPQCTEQAVACSAGHPRGPRALLGQLHRLTNQSYRQSGWTVSLRSDGSVGAPHLSLHWVETSAMIHVLQLVLFGFCTIGDDRIGSRLAWSWFRTIK